MNAYMTSVYAVPQLLSCNLVRVAGSAPVEVQKKENGQKHAYLSVIFRNRSVPRAKRSTLHLSNSQSPCFRSG